MLYVPKVFDRMTLKWICMGIKVCGVSVSLLLPIISNGHHIPCCLLFFLKMPSIICHVYWRYNVSQDVNVMGVKHICRYLSAVSNMIVHNSMGIVLCLVLPASLSNQFVKACLASCISKLKWHIYPALRRLWDCKCCTCSRHYSEMFVVCSVMFYFCFRKQNHIYWVRQSCHLQSIGDLKAWCRHTEPLTFSPNTFSFLKLIEGLSLPCSVSWSFAMQCFLYFYGTAISSLRKKHALNLILLYECGCAIKKTMLHLLYVKHVLCMFKMHQPKAQQKQAVFWMCGP